MLHCWIRTAAALCLFLWATAATAQAPVLPDGRRMNLVCTGEGRPVVILEGGLGLPLEVWQKVQSELARTARTCAYNRAGYPGSDAGPMPRDGAHAAADLDALLKAARLPPPYVLVGHSIAADHVRLYAARHPDAVAGLVLVDPAIRDQDLRFAAISKASATASLEANDVNRRCIGAVASGAFWSAGDPAFAPCGPPPPRDSYLANRPMAQAALSEMDNIEVTHSQAAAARGLAPYPIVVLTADRSRQVPPGMTAEEQAAILALMAREHAALAATSRKGVQRIVRDSGHVIQVDQPQAVVQAVRELAEGHVAP